MFGLESERNAPRAAPPGTPSAPAGERDGGAAAPPSVGRPEAAVRSEVLRAAALELIESEEDLKYRWKCAALRRERRAVCGVAGGPVGRRSGRRRRSSPRHSRRRRTPGAAAPRSRGRRRLAPGRRRFLPGLLDRRQLGDPHRQASRRRGCASARGVSPPPPGSASPDPDSDARLLLCGRGGGPRVSLHPMLPGPAVTRGRYLETPETGRERCARAVGHFLAALHRTDLALPRAHGVPTADDNARYALLPERVRSTLLPRLPEPVRRWTEEVLAKCAETDATAAFLPSLLHGDLGPDHVLFDEGAAKSAESSISGTSSSATPSGTWSTSTRTTGRTSSRGFSPRTLSASGRPSSAGCGGSWSWKPSSGPCGASGSKTPARWPKRSNFCGSCSTEPGGRASAAAHHLQTSGEA